MQAAETGRHTGEKPVFRTRLHPITLTEGALFAALALVAAALVIRHNDLAVATNVRVALGGVAVAALSICPGLWRWWSAELIVTGKRLTGKLGGFLRPHAVDVPLAAIQTVTVEQTRLGRWLGYGTVRLELTDGGYDRFRPVIDATALRDALLRGRRNPS